MPSDLAALLVEEGAVSKADMDRAVARQSQLGGGLDTALLELELIQEPALLASLARASGLPPAPQEALADVDARARRVFPAKVAERHRLAPLALDGRELSVVASYPFDAAAIDEIGFMLSLTLVPHVGVEWRVHELIHRLYGGQPSARLAKLAEAERRRPPPGPSQEEASPQLAPPPSPGPAAAPAPAPPAAAAAPANAGAMSIEEAFFAAGEAGSFTPSPGSIDVTPAAAPPPAPEPRSVELPPSPEPVAAEPSPSPEPSHGPPAAPVAEPPLAEPAAADAFEPSFADIQPAAQEPTGFARDDSEPTEPLLAALEQAVDLYDALWADKGPAPAPAEPEPGEAPVAPPVAEPTAPAPEAAVVQPEPAEAGASPPVEEAPGEEEPEGPPPELDRTAPPRWSIDDARTALAAARHRDEIVLVALRYARDFFEFSALFAVTRDAVAGHDALGVQEDARLHCRGTAIYANDPGIVRTVLETGAPYLGPVTRDAVGTRNVLDGLWRGTPRTVLLYPMLIADRPVAVLYADNGDAPVSARRLGDLLLFLSTVGGGFERVIRARKRRRRAPRPPPLAEPVAAPEPPVPDPAPTWMEPPPTAEPTSDPAPAPAVASAAPGPEAIAAPPGPEIADPPASAPLAEAAPDPEPAPEAPAPEPSPDLAAPPAPAEPASVTPAPVEAAIAALLGGPKPGADSVAPIVELLLDGNPEVAAAARAALVAHRRENAMKPVPERLRRALLSGVGERPVLGARALGALRDVESIPILIQALEGSSPGAAADALAEITLQGLGPDPRKWLKWWKENRGRSRAEWLFAALTSSSVEARKAAAKELRAAAEPPVRYEPEMPSAELEAAARAWWVWWSRQGIAI